MVSDAQIAEPSSRIARALEPGESVAYTARFHWAVHELLIVMTMIMLAVVVFSLAVEPGFIRIAILPGILWLGGILVSARTWNAVVVVTNRRVMVVGAGTPTSIRFGEFGRIGATQGPVGRMLGYGQVFVWFLRDAEDPSESRWARAFQLRMVREAAQLSQEIVAASERGGFSVEVLG